MPAIPSSARFFFLRSGALTATVAHVYTFDAGDTASGTYNVAVTDRATNQTTVPFTVIRDATAPTVVLTVAERIAASAIPVQWSAIDLGSGVQHYDVEYQIANGDWTPWLTATTQTQVTFTGTLGVAYTFRMRATDNVNNTSAWVQAEAKTVVVKKYYTVAGQRVATRSNGVLYYLHSDHLGSTSLTTDESGNVAAAQKYLPYGEVRWVTGTLPTDFTYTGQRADAYTQLAEMGARWYSPRLGRWISPDPIIPDPANPQSWNRYSYVYNRPFVYVDKDGHFPWPVVILLAALLTLPGDTGPYGIESPFSQIWNYWQPMAHPVIRDDSLRPSDPTSPYMTEWLIDVMKTNAQAPVTQQIRENWTSPWAWKKDAALQAWSSLVGTGAIWDLKVNIDRARKFVDGTRTDVVLGGETLHFDVVANIHFGFVGRAAGIGEEVLAVGAGIAQLNSWKKTGDPRELGDCRVTSGCYCDHPYATWALRFGSYLYDEYGVDGLSAETFAKGLKAYLEKHPLPAPPPFP